MANVSQSELSDFRGHSLIESTWGSIREIGDPNTRLKVLDGLAEVLKYERLQALKARPNADSDWLLFVDGSSMDRPPQFD